MRSAIAFALFFAGIALGMAAFVLKIASLLFIAIFCIIGCGIVAWKREG
jgi:hypothetical protein